MQQSPDLHAYGKEGRMHFRTSSTPMSRGTRNIVAVGANDATRPSANLFCTVDVQTGKPVYAVSEVRCSITKTNASAIATRLRESISASTKNAMEHHPLRGK